MNPINKQSMEDFGRLQDELSQAGKLVTIKRLAQKNYEVIINFNVVKHYKQRRSCRRFITKLHEQTFNTNLSSTN